MILNVSHYSFFDVKSPNEARARLFEIIGTETIRGTVLIAREGVNLNLAGEEKLLKKITTEWLREIGCIEFAYKLSYSEELTFKRLKIKVKKEIITMGLPDLNVCELKAPHIAPGEFKKILKSPEPDTLILDTRNDFEVELGTFEGAKAAGMQSFRDFTKVADELPRDKKIIMFCTGGVRCEKASALLRKKGFQHVFQLEGGILRYIEQEGYSHFKGECFVFDDRRSVGPRDMMP